ncbi:MAG: cation:proton antiporter [Rhodospirillales bacterium]|nr:cation:proton antiporter [Rhodospirillales bacterium]
MESYRLFNELAVFLIATVVVVPLFERLRASPLVGYLLAGLLVGPNMAAVIDDAGNVRMLAELGVVVMLFTIGLELTVERLRHFKPRLMGLGLVQIGLTGLAIGAFGYPASGSLAGALVLGGALAFSSTAVVLQLLQERHEMATRLGRTSLAVLLLQDMALGPLLVLVPVLGGHGGNVGMALLVAGLKAGLVLAMILIVGRRLLRPLFRHVAKARAPELFMALILAVILATGMASAWAGLSMALGAFAAGMLLAETEHRHRIAETIQPFRGLLMGLFFLSVGMAIDPRLAVERAGLVLGLVVGLLLVKAAILVVAARLFGLNWITAARLGLLLAQGSEFAFVLLDMARAERVLSGAVADPVLLAVVFSMAVTPLLAMLAGWLSRRFEPHAAPGLDGLALAVADLDYHVVISGLGRVGRGVAERFVARGVPFVALETSRAKVIDARVHGLPVFNLDATDLEALSVAGVERAQAVVVALGAEQGAAHLVATLRYLFPSLRILARAKDEAHGRLLVRAGADEVVVERQDAGDRLASAVAVSVDA